MLDNWTQQILAREFPTISSAVSEIAALRAQLELPKGVIHVMSDVHGEDAKLRHVINNASGRLRPLAAQLFAEELSEDEFHEFLNVLYYPAEVLQSQSMRTLHEKERTEWVQVTLTRQFILIRELIRTRRRNTAIQLIPKEWRELFEILLNAPAGGHDPRFLYVQIREMIRRHVAFDAVRAASRFIRDLTVEETIVAGDLGDRGPRIDYVIDYLQHQPNVSLVWGNHDVSWMGACLGSDALIAVVLRLSLRYRRLYQLEEGYGLPTKALEHLALSVYGTDTAERFLPKRNGVRDPLLIARMHKAAAILEFKLQGQLISRHPEWEMEDRNLLPKIDYTQGTIRLNGKDHALLDTYFPTIDPSDPNRLSPEEQECIDRLRESFTTSPRLWQQMKWVAERGQMSLVRDRAVIFHACLAIDKEGKYLPLEIEGQQYGGPKQLAVFDRIIKRSFRAGAENITDNDRDWFYYLWAGPRSPLFGKDRMTTFERYFIADPDCYKETKNPWFQKIHDHDFCQQVCDSFHVYENGIIVNGHVPVKVEQGENPVKRGGNAITIDGAFSSAYGDHGYTLILAPEGEFLAEHHAFPDPVQSSLQGEDLIPTMSLVRKYDTPRTVSDTRHGNTLRAGIRALEDLVSAYESGELQENSDYPN